MVRPKFLELDDKTMTIWNGIMAGARSLKAAFDGLAFDSAAGGDDAPGSPAGTRKIAFTIGVIALAAKMARADGVVSRLEVDAFQKAFHVDPAELVNVARVFNLAKRDAAGFETYARQIAALFEPASPVLEELLDSLIFVARGDGELGPAELNFLRAVAEIFGFDRTGFARIRAAHLVGPECDPYDVIGVPCGAPDPEVRRAYLDLVRTHHPDRLVAEGMPAEFAAIANARMAAINAAYDRIRAQPREAI